MKKAKDITTDDININYDDIDISEIDNIYVDDIDDGIDYKNKDKNDDMMIAAIDAVAYGRTTAAASLKNLVDAVNLDMGDRRVTLLLLRDFGIYAARINSKNNKNIKEVLIMANDNQINDSFDKGTAAEQIIALALIKNSWQIKDVRKIDKYRQQDIDFIISNTDYVDHDISIDVKSDDCFKYGNYAIELISNIESNKIGWGYGSNADYIFVYYPAAAEVHIINMILLKPWLIKNAGKYAQKINGTKGKYGNDVLYHSSFICINRDYLMQQLGPDSIEICQISQDIISAAAIKAEKKAAA